MGLDIIAYKKLEKNDSLTKLTEDKKYYLWEMRKAVYLPSSFKKLGEIFPGRELPFKYDGSVYGYSDLIEYRIGSYSTYNWFRKLIEHYVDMHSNEFPSLENFKLLTDFSDCEGLIGTDACKSLFNIFSIHKHGFDVWITGVLQPADYSWAMTIYEKFKDAFEFASDGGAVEFC